MLREGLTDRFLLSEVFKTLLGMKARGAQLMTIHKAGGTEISRSLNP
jgi:hypothetical protein